MNEASRYLLNIDGVDRVWEVEHYNLSYGQHLLKVEVLSDPERGEFEVHATASDDHAVSSHPQPTLVEAIEDLDWSEFLRK